MLKEEEKKNVTSDGTLTISGGRRVVRAVIDTADEVDKEVLRPIEWIVDGMIPTGLSVLGAPPKSFKSYMMLHLCACVATGAEFLGRQTHQHACLYLDLESTKRRPQSRLRQILGEDTPKPHDLYISTSEGGWARIGEGFEEQLTDVVTEHPEIRLVVVDVLSYIRPLGNVRAKEYDRDYATMAPLKKLADKLDIAIILVTHTTKMAHPDDPFNGITGSMGVTGACDAQMVICKRRDQSEGRLIVTGRDAEYIDLAVCFNQQSMKWECLGTPEERAQRELEAEYDKSDVIRAIFSLLRGRDEWSGTVEDMMAEVPTLASYDPRQVGRQITRYQDLLWSRDRVSHECNMTRVSGDVKRLHAFKRL